MKYTNGIFGNDKRETMSKYGNNDRDDPVPEERGSRFRLPVIAWLSVLFFAACTKMSPEDGVARHDGTLVRLTVSLPQPALPTKGARAGSLSGDAENRIEDVMILVLEQENGKYVYRYMTEGERLESTGSGTQFQAKLLSTSKPVKLMLAGNYGDAFAAYAPSPSHSEAEVKAGIGCSFTGAAQSLPMYGEIAVPSGLEADRENRFSVKMLRAVARIDVEKDLTADSRPLRIESVRLYRPNDKIQLAPDESFAPESPQVTAPSVFAGAVKSQSPVVTETSEPDPVSIAGIYVPEADGVADAAARLTEATCIVVGGYYDGQSQPTYYRVDFDPGLEGHPFGQILRNYKYVFRIRKVTGPGWSDPGLAAVNKATSIVAEIEPWEDFTTEMHFEGDQLYRLVVRSVTLGYRGKSRPRWTFRQRCPYTIQWLDASGSLVGTGRIGRRRLAAGRQRLYGLDRAELRRRGDGHAIGLHYDSR